MEIGVVENTIKDLVLFWFYRRERKTGRWVRFGAERCKLATRDHVINSLKLKAEVVFLNH